MNKNKSAFEFLLSLSENLNIGGAIRSVGISSYEARLILSRAADLMRRDGDNDTGSCFAGYLVIKIDGASRGNPGKAGIGVVIRDDEGNLMGRLAEPIGIATNNVAEYRSLIAALSMAVKMRGRRLKIFSDSELVVKHINGAYKVKSPKLRPLYLEAKKMLSRFECYEIIHVDRSKNREADELANTGIDRAADSQKE